MKRLLTFLALTFSAATSFGATLNAIQLLNPAGSTVGQAIVSTGPSTAPAWAPVTATALAAQAANTVVANVTAASASPTAVALPSCSTANSALKYTTSTGFSCGTTYALTSGTLAQFAATTSAQLLGIISDETGSGALVFGTSPTIGSPAISGGTITNAPISGSTGSFTTLAASSTVSGAGFSTYLAAPPAIGGTTPAAGAFTTLAASGLITPTSTIGIKGTATNDSAQAGSVGEFVCAQVTNGGSPAGCATNSSTPVSLTTNITANITSISLTAGNWLVFGNVGFVPAGTTVVTAEGGWTSTASATLALTPNNGSFSFYNGLSSTAGANQNTFSVGMQTLKLSATTTVFLEGFSAFSVSTQGAIGFIGAWRIR